MSIDFIYLTLDAVICESGLQAGEDDRKRFSMAWRKQMTDAVYRMIWDTLDGSL